MEVDDGGALRERRARRRELHAQNLALAFEATVDRLGDDPAIRTGEGDDEVGSPGTSSATRSARIAGGLAKLGVGKGDTVAIMLNNRPEFIPCDLAAVSLGGGPVLDLPDLLAGADPVRGLATPRRRSRSSRRRSSTSSTRRARTCRRSRR